MISRTIKSDENISKCPAIGSMFPHSWIFPSNGRPYNVIKKENKTMKIVHLSSKVQYFLLLYNSVFGTVICTGTHLKSISRKKNYHST